MGLHNIIVLHASNMHLQEKLRVDPLVVNGKVRQQGFIGIHSVNLEKK